MPSLEINELIMLIICLIPAIFFPYLIGKRRDIMKWGLGFYSLFMVFLSTNLEAFVAPDFFNFLEHFFIMVAGIFMCFTAIYEYNKKVLKEKGKQIYLRYKKVSSER